MMSDVHSELWLIQGKSPLTLLRFPGVCKSQNTDVETKCHE